MVVPSLLTRSLGFGRIYWATRIGEQQNHRQEELSKHSSCGACPGFLRVSTSGLPRAFLADAVRRTRASKFPLRPRPRNPPPRFSAVGGRKCSSGCDQRQRGFGGVLKSSRLMRGIPSILAILSRFRSLPRSRSTHPWWPVLQCRSVAGLQLSTEGCSEPLIANHCKYRRRRKRSPIDGQSL